MEISAAPEAFTPRTKYVALTDGTFVLVSGHSGWLHSAILALLRQGTECPVSSAGFCTLSASGEVRVFGESATLGASSTPDDGVAITRVIQANQAIQVYLPEAYSGGPGIACWMLTCGTTLAQAIQHPRQSTGDSADAAEAFHQDILFEPLPVTLLKCHQVLARYQEMTSHWL